MPEEFLLRWKAAKKKFETATGKKKPDDKSKLGKLFGKLQSTGLEGSLKAFDGAKTMKDAVKHAKSFQTAAKAYLPVLDAAEKAAKDEKNTVYAKACDELAKDLNEIAGDVMTATERFDSFPKDILAAVKSPYWSKILRKYCVQEFSVENLDFVELALTRKLNGNDEAIEQAYGTFLAKNAPKEINLPNAVASKCHEAAAKGQWQAMPLADVYTATIANLSDTWPRFTEAVRKGEI